MTILDLVRRELVGKTLLRKHRQVSSPAKITGVDLRYADGPATGFAIDYTITDKIGRKRRDTLYLDLDDEFDLEYVHKTFDQS